jgi:hypothetical protein
VLTLTATVVTSIRELTPDVVAGST